MKKILFILFFILLSTSVYSAQLNTFYNLEISYGKYHTINQDKLIHTHVYNSEDGLLVTTGISCYYHIYSHNNGGNHIFMGNLTQYGAGYSDLLNGSYLNEVGEYSVLIWCNSSTQGGFSQYNFEVSDYGYINEDYKEDRKALVLAFIGLAFLFLYLAFNLDSDHFLLKLICIFFAIYSIMSLATGFYNIQTGQYTLLRIPLWFFRLFLMYFSGYLFWHWIGFSKLIERVLKI